MITLAEQYALKIFQEETKTGEITKTGLAASTVGGGLVGLGAYYLYKKYKQSKIKADIEQDPAKKNAMKAKANQMKQDADKKKIMDQKKERLQKAMQRA